MEKYVLSIYWQVDVRTKLIPRDTVINDRTPYGTLTSVKSPICDYTEDYTTMLCLELNETTTQKLIRQINEQTPLDIIKLYKIKIFFGVLGFATMELYATFDLASYPDLATTWVTIQEDNHKVVEFFSWNAPLVASMINSGSKYTTGNPDFYFGIHKKLTELMIKHGIASSDECNDTYVYTYNTLTTSQQTADQLRNALNMSDNLIMMGDCKSWQLFGNHLWVVPSEKDDWEAHELASATILSAWQVLIYDLGAINYKNILRLLTNNIPFSTKYIKNIINKDNLSLLELRLAIRDLNNPKTFLTERSYGEYNDQDRFNAFNDGQKSLEAAASGIDTDKQSTSSHTIEVVISILTVMSIYSLVTDTYTMLTFDKFPNPISNVASWLFSLATLFCITMIILLIRRSK